MLRSLRYGEADRILHLYTPDRGRIERDRQGRAAGAVALRRPAGAVLPPQPRALRGPQRPADGHQRRDGRRPSAAARGRRRRSTARPAPARPSRACSTTATRTPASTTCSPTSSRCSTASRRRAGRANALAFRLKLLLAAGFAPQLAGCASCGEREHLVGFSGAAGGVVCAACEASAFPLDQEAHDFLVAALGRPLAEAPDAPPRALAQAERAILETLEHHAHVRLRPVGAGVGSRPDAVGLRLRRGLAGHARPARRQGRQRRRDDARARRRARPRRLHDHHRGVRRLHEGRPGGARGHGRAGRGRARAAAGARRASGSATTRTRCSSPSAPARASRCPGCSTRCSTSASTTRRSRAWRARPTTSASPGTPTGASCRCSATSPAASPGEKFEDAIKEVKAERGVKDDTELDVDALKELTKRFQELYDFPQDPQEQLQPGDPRGVRLLDRRARRRLPAHQPHPRRLGHRGQRPADGVRQQGRHVRAPASRSAATRSPARPSRPATSSSTPRARTSSPACATRSTSPR